MSASIVAIEGIDGSGKGTQARLLYEALGAQGCCCELISFPRYDETTFGRAIARYLNGEFGDLDAVGPYFPALLYAGDRFESLPLIARQRLAQTLLIFDRYVPSNLAHQAAKLPEDRRDEFVAWVEAIEYDVYGLPKPDLVLWLDMPVQSARKLIARKPSRRYTRRPADQHEADYDYLQRTAEIYRSLAQRRSNWQRIACQQDGEIRSPQAIHQQLLELVQTSISR